MKPHGFEDLGGLEKPEDLRDIKLGAVVAPIYTYPKVIKNLHAWAQPVEYQGHQPACGAHSGAALMGIDKESRYTPRFTWANIKSFDGFPLDAGTDMRSIFKSITKTGALYFYRLENNVELSLTEYAHPALTQAMYTLAGLRKGDGYGFIEDKTWDGLKQYISDHGAIVLLIRIGPEFWTAPSGQTSWAEKDILPLRPPKKVTSGHFVIAHSYDEKYIYFLNSFSDGWGLKGHGYFDTTYIPFVTDAGTLIKVPFKKDLRQGMIDIDVLKLQKQLNKDARTLVSATGPGSVGQETNFFGTKTLDAVIRFQRLYDIVPQSGFVGPITRGVLNSIAQLP